jgi:hypothetical protein
VDAGVSRFPVDRLVIPVLGSLATLVGVYVAATQGASIGVGAIAVVLLYVLGVIAYLSVPHIALAGTIATFAFVPALKVFLTPTIGGVKDVLCLSAITAGAILIAFGHRRPDRRVSLLVFLFMALYLVNAGHSHGVAWLQGVRLTGEPILLLLVGFVLPDPQRNLRWALRALIIVGLLVALYGLAQQLLGQYTLVSLGYAFNVQVRTIGGRLRSFGTFDDPFAYAGFLYFSIAAVIFWLRRGSTAWFAGTLLMLGLAVSFVRTAALVLVAFGALWLLRQRHPVPALALLATTAVLGAITLAGSSTTQTQVVPVYLRHGGVAMVNSPVPSAGGLVLNGRVSAWTAALGNRPVDWIFGRGVGKVGTAASRASGSLIPTVSPSTTSAGGQSGGQSAVDSGYLATMADVGIVGLAVLLALITRIGVLISRSIHAGRDEGWVTAAMLVAILIDAVTRASITGFPTAFVALPIIGVSLAATQDALSGKPVRNERQASPAPEVPISL